MIFKQVFKTSETGAFSLVGITFLNTTETFAMHIRFTSFLKEDFIDIAMYIVQEPHNENLLCFTILIQNDDKTYFTLLKDSAQNWEIVTQDCPDWITRNKPQFVSIIEQHLSVA